VAVRAVEVSIDGIRFVLRREHDFTWLRELGRVFRVFDQQDSGNLSFGVQGRDRRFFVKYAGAETIHYGGRPEEAVSRLRHAAGVYEALRHPNLVNLLARIDTPGGFAAVFEWFDGEDLHPHRAFPAPLKYTHPDSPYFRFRRLPVARRLAAMDAILDFHCHVEASGYVAVDFYDGSIMYGFSTGETMICDIDLYQRKPYYNTMGRMYGSSRFMSPEEFTLGAVIDGRTNVFNMGAAAFVLLGGAKDRPAAKWEAGKALFEVAARAVSTERSLRHASVAGLKEAWDQAMK